MVEWRGPAPFYFLRLSPEVSEELKIAAAGVEYWGQVPVVVRIGGIEFFTALFPKDGVYLVPLKNAVRIPLGAAPGEILAGALRVGRP